MENPFDLRQSYRIPEDLKKKMIEDKNEIQQWKESAEMVSFESFQSLNMKMEWRNKQLYFST
eukprot:15365172-Ditylum_brightwellii.AAC.1